MKTEKNKMMATLAAVAMKLASSGGQVPEGHLFAELGDRVTLQEFNEAMRFGEDEQLWSVAPSHMTKLKPRGAKFAGEVVDAISTE